MATSHHHPTPLLDSSSKRMCSDSDLGPAILPVRDHVLHCSHVPQPRLPQLGNSPRPVPARCWPDFRKTFDQSRTAQLTRDSDSIASDVASQGGGAGPGRDRHRRARSAVRARWRGGPSPETVSGHQGEAWRNVARGRGGRGPRPEKRGSSEDLLAISRADFCLIRGPAGAVTGIIRWGGAS
jgi:hypothetical protein